MSCSHQVVIYETSFKSISKNRYAQNQIFFCQTILFYFYFCNDEKQDYANSDETPVAFALVPGRLVYVDAKSGRRPIELRPMAKSQSSERRFFRTVIFTV